jgi:hypothetical protein
VVGGSKGARIKLSKAIWQREAGGWGEWGN